MTSCVLVLLALLPVVGAILVAWGIAWRVTRPGRHSYWDEYSFRPSDMGAPYEDVRFSSGDGIRLAAWLMIQGSDGPTVVMGSGYRERKVSLLPIAVGLWRRGFNVLLLDFRCQGDSGMDTAQTMGWRELQDMLAAVDFMRSRLPQSKIGAMGWSMGAAVTVLAAARDPGILAVVADSGYADQASVIAHNFSTFTHLPPFPFVSLAEVFFRLRAGYRPSRVRPEDVIGRIAPRPVLIIHGQEDDICPVSHAHRLYARAGDPKVLWIAPHAKHVGAYFADPDGYIERVAEFLHAALG